MFLKKNKWVFSAVIVLLLNGCSAIGKIENEPVAQLPDASQGYYSAINYGQKKSRGDTLFVLAFSGGGTRAAALSYGVLEELRDTHYQLDGKDVRLLDEVDQISSVSGGSFTSAYYGLFGDQIFEDFKHVFLYKDVQGDLSGMILGVFNMIGGMFSTTSRTEKAINYYDKHIFRGKTFADLQESEGPFLFINATDLNSQSQFTFVQPQFDFLCSDLSQFKIARAVAASSAVPILFPPILLERHGDCDYEKPVWLSNAEETAEKENDKRLEDSVSALNYYIKEKNPPYVTLLDGGITDNLGLRAIINSVKLSGGAKKKFDKAQANRKPPRQVVILIVDASTSTDTGIGKTTTLPSIGDTLSAVTDIQLRLYNTETNTLAKEELKEWITAVSSKENPITPYFIDLNVTGIQDKDDRIFFNQVPTSFSLEKEQADRLIELAKDMLRHNPEYQKLLQQLGAVK